MRPAKKLAVGLYFLLDTRDFGQQNTRVPLISKVKAGVSCRAHDSK
jgi:hypothetical protein